MGEYAMNGVKLGVMDDLRYVRRSELEAWKKWDLDVIDFLGDPSTLYRFPWPGEDGQSIADGDPNERDMFATVIVSTPGLHNHHSELGAANIFGERYDSQGRARTIFRCVECDSLFSISEDDLETIKQNNDPSEIINRILPNMS